MWISKALERLDYEYQQKATKLTLTIYDKNKFTFISFAQFIFHILPQSVNMDGMKKSTYILLFFHLPQRTQIRR